MANLLKSVEIPQQTRQWNGRELLVILLMSCVVAAPFIQLREIYRIIPAQWSDLYPQWLGVQAIVHGRNPYTAQMTFEIQRKFYGHVLGPKEQWDQQPFVYPAHLAFLLVPFTLLPWWLVRLLFTIAGPPVIAATAWAWWKVCGLELSRKRLIYFLLLTLASWPAVWAFTRQQPTVFVAAFIAFSILLLQRGRDTWAGILLSLATVKPNLVLFVAAWLMMVAVAQRRSRFLTAFLGATFLMILGAEVLLPGWLPKWIHASIACAHAPHKTSQLILVFGPWLGAATTIIALAALCIRLWAIGTPDPQGREFAGTISLLLAVTICVIPPTNPWMLYNDLLLIPGILVIIHRHPSHGIAQFVRRLAIVTLAYIVAITPASAAITLLFGHNPLVSILPFLDVVLPIAVMAALLFIEPETSPAENPQRATAIAMPTEGPGLRLEGLLRRSFPGKLRVRRRRRLDANFGQDG